MKKKILGLALLCMSLVAFNGNAKTTDNKAADSCKVEQCKKDKCDKKDCKDTRKDGKADRKVKAGDPRMAAFEGINLSETQKAQLQQLSEKRRSQRQKADSTSRAERRTDRKAEKRQFLQEVKTILGPDDYVVFLENCYLQEAPRAQMHRSGKEMRLDKGQRPERRPDKADRQRPERKDRGEKN